MLDVVFSERARLEMMEGWEWYESKQMGLGDVFISTVISAVSKIQVAPLKGTKSRFDFRESPLKALPYIIIYRVELDVKVLFISSIFHTGRNPQKKYK